MAISKQQPMRPAEIALIDASNSHESTLGIHQASLNTLAEGLADEISDREAADTQLGVRIDNETQARANGDAALQGQLGEGFSTALTVAQSLDATNRQVLLLGQEQDATDTAVSALNAFKGRFRVGLTEAMTIAAEGSQAGSVTFDTAYADTAQVCVFMCCVDAGEIFTQLECQLVSATHSGFSYNIANNDTVDSHTVSLGFVAVQVN